MTRRSFFNAKIAGLFALKLAGDKSLAGASEPRRLPRARWIQNGLIDAGGKHEPYSFVVRRGGQRLDAHEVYQRAQSEEVIRGLKASGVEVFHTHFYKGAGMVHERAEMEDAKKVAAIAHLGSQVPGFARVGLQIEEFKPAIGEPFDQLVSSGPNRSRRLDPPGSFFDIRLEIARIMLADRLRREIGIVGGT